MTTKCWRVWNTWKNGRGETEADDYICYIWSPCRNKARRKFQNEFLTDYDDYTAIRAVRVPELDGEERSTKWLYEHGYYTDE